jgi:ribosome-associated protein
MPESEPLKPDENSRSKRKEEMLALQKMGESLTRLSDAQLANMNLPENLLSAIQECRSLKTKEAKRRQLQYIGKLMRTIDSELIIVTLKNIQSVHEKNTQQFHQIEKWRTQLIEESDEALNAFINEYTEAERQQLRQLIRKAQQDKKNDKNTGAEKALFKYIQAILQNNKT